MSATSPPTAPERSGFYVRGWVLAVVGVVLAAAAAIAIGVAVSDGGDGDGREFGRFGEHHDGGGHRGLGIIIVLVLIALAITGVVLLVRRSRANANAAPTSAEAVLAERFARGEIDEADYRSRREALRAG